MFCVNFITVYFSTYYIEIVQIVIYKYVIPQQKDR